MAFILSTITLPAIAIPLLSDTFILLSSVICDLFLINSDRYTDALEAGAFNLQAQGISLADKYRKVYSSVVGGELWWEN